MQCLVCVLCARLCALCSIVFVKCHQVYCSCSLHCVQKSAVPQTVSRIEPRQSNPAQTAAKTAPPKQEPPPTLTSPPLEGPPSQTHTHALPAAVTATTFAPPALAAQEHTKAAPQPEDPVRVFHGPGKLCDPAWVQVGFVPFCYKDNV